MAKSFQACILCLSCVVFTVTAKDEYCFGNTTCVNYEVCGDFHCECPYGHYGATCENSVSNVVIIALICTLPPLSWIFVCCYGVHGRNLTKRINQRSEGQSSSGNELESGQGIQEEIIDDHPPPTYAQVLHYDNTGLYGDIELTLMNEGSDNDTGNVRDETTPDSMPPPAVEPPPSYEEWTRTAASLREQEIDANGGREQLTTISGSTRAAEPESIEGGRADVGINLSSSVETGQERDVVLGICNPVCNTHDEEQC